MTTNRHGCAACGWIWLQDPREERATCPVCAWPVGKTRPTAPELLAQAWAGYVELKLDGVHSDIVEQCRLAFYSGAQAMLLGILMFEAADDHGRCFADEMQEVH